MSNHDSRLFARMPVRYDSFYGYGQHIQMEEEPMLPLLSTVATLTLSTLSSAALTNPSSNSSPASLNTSPTTEEGMLEVGQSNFNHEPLRHTSSYGEVGASNFNHEETETLRHTSSYGEVRKPFPGANNVACEIAKRFKNCMPQTPGESDLHRAAFNGDIEYLRSLLTDGDPMKYKRSKINQKNRLGCTPIRLAATGGHLECLSLLIEAGAAIDAVDVKCQTPLFVAIKNRRLECALKLLQCGAKPEGDPGNSSTPLYVAIMNADVRYLLLLLEFGADPDKLRHSRVASTIHNHKFTSLNMVIDNFGGEDYIMVGIKALLKAGCSKDNSDLSSVILNDYSKLLDLLYESGVPFGSKEKIDRILAEFPRHNACKERLQHIGENARSLMSSCRIAILKCLEPCQPFDDLSSLPLPNALLSYVTFQHD